MERCEVFVFEKLNGAKFVTTQWFGTVADKIGDFICTVRTKPESFDKQNSYNNSLCQLPHQ